MRTAGIPKTPGFSFISTTRAGNPTRSAFSAPARAWTARIACAINSASRAATVVDAVGAVVGRVVVVAKVTKGAVVTKGAAGADDEEE
jgi:hypothetical protein